LFAKPSVDRRLLTKTLHGKGVFHVRHKRPETISSISDET
jgi:hypothetical protein